MNGSMATFTRTPWKTCGRFSSDPLLVPTIKSVKHLDAYLDELQFRFNNSKNEWLFCDTLKKLVEADKLTYKELVDRASA